MLTRIGARPGPAWMRSLSDGAVDPSKYRKFMKWFWLLFVVFMLLAAGLNRYVLSTGFRKGGSNYESKARIGNLPVISLGAAPRGVVAIGGRPTGVIAVGGLAVGVIAVGGLALGGVALGGVSVGLLALAGLALGWRAIGGCAAGHAALGGLAIGRYAYAGHGVAFGYDEASGTQEEKLVG
jgi:hypothetical protein